MMEEGKKENKKMTAPISSSQALQIAMRDPETSHFIKSNFSCPEQRSKIVSRRWTSKDWLGCKWYIEIIEKHKFPLGKAGEMMNIARIEIDLEGRITRRQFLRNILENEYEKFLGPKASAMCIRNRFK